MNFNETELIESIRQGKFSKGIWITFLVAGLFMTYGGVMNVFEFFGIRIPLAPLSWHAIDSRVILCLGIVNLIGAAYLIVKSFEIRVIINKKRKNRIKILMIKLLIVSIIGVIVDLIAGYYARGYMVALLGLMYLCYLIDRKRKIFYLLLSVMFVTLIVLSFIYTGFF